MSAWIVKLYLFIKSIVINNLLFHCTTKQHLAEWNTSETDARRAQGDFQEDVKEQW